MRQTDINAEQPEIVRRVEGLFVLADQLDLRLAQWPVLRFWDKYAVSGSGTEPALVTLDNGYKKGMGEKEAV